MLLKSFVYACSVKFLTIPDAPDYRVDAAVPMSYETHAGEDVAIYATGHTGVILSILHEISKARLIDIVTIWRMFYLLR